MDKLLILVESAYCVELFFYKVLHSLNVVVGSLLYLLHTLCLLLSHIAIDVAQLLEESLWECRQLRQGQLAQRYEILYLYANTITDKGILREVF